MLVALSCVLGVDAGAEKDNELGHHGEARGERRGCRRRLVLLGYRRHSFDLAGSHPRGSRVTIYFEMDVPHEKLLGTELLHRLRTGESLWTEFQRFSVGISLLESLILILTWRRFNWVNARTDLQGGRLKDSRVE